MRSPSCKSRLIALAVLVAGAAGPAHAGASEADAPVLSSGFANGTGGWTATASCAPLCSVANTIDPGPGASGPGSATVIYTALSGLLGSLAAGTSTWDVAELHMAGRNARPRDRVPGPQGGHRQPARGRRHGELARPAGRPDCRKR